MMEAVKKAGPGVSVKAACGAVKLPKATFYRYKKVPFGPQPRKTRPSPQRTLSAAERQKTLDNAYEKHPERFVKNRPKLPKLPKAVWINPPKKEEKTMVIYTN